MESIAYDKLNELEHNLSGMLGSPYLWNSADEIDKEPKALAVWKSAGQDSNLYLRMIYPTKTGAHLLPMRNPEIVRVVKGRLMVSISFETTTGVKRVSQSVLRQGSVIELTTDRTWVAMRPVGDQPVMTASLVMPAFDNFKDVSWRNTKPNMPLEIDRKNWLLKQFEAIYK